MQAVKERSETDGLSLPQEIKTEN